MTDTPDFPAPDPAVPPWGEPPVAPPVPPGAGYPAPPAAPTFPPPAMGTGYPPPGYPAEGAAFAAAQPVLGPRTEGTAVAALVCAVLSWFLVPVVLAIVALVLARSAEKAIDAQPAELSGRGLVTGARWVAWVHLVLVAMVVAFLSAFAIALWVGR